MAALLSLWPSLGKAPESCPCLKSQDIKVYKAHCPKKEFKSNTGCQTVLPTQLPPQYLASSLPTKIIIKMLIF